MNDKDIDIVRVCKKIDCLILNIRFLVEDDDYREILLSQIKNLRSEIYED